MGLTLLGYVRQHPQLAGRAYLEVAPGTAAPVSPYALVWDKPGAVTDPYYGGQALMSANPCVTVYCKPAAGESPADARLRCMTIARELLGAVGVVDTHSDGVSLFRPGTFQLQAEIPARVDATVSGQFYSTVQFTASLFRP